MLLLRPGGLPSEIPQKRRGWAEGGAAAGPPGKPGRGAPQALPAVSVPLPQLLSPCLGSLRASRPKGELSPRPFPGQPAASDRLGREGNPAPVLWGGTNRGCDLHLRAAAGSGLGEASPKISPFPPLLSLLPWPGFS